MTGSNHVFMAPWWCRDPHAQTILGRFLRRSLPVNYARERFETPDRDFLEVDFLRASSPRGKICLVIFHGLEGWSGAPYTLSLAAEAAGRGWSVAAVNFRGCSLEKDGGRLRPVPNRLASSYHSGKSEDIGFVLNEIRKREPDARLAAAGYSIGGNLLLKWMGEEGAAAGKILSAAAAVSVPYDLSKSVEVMDRGFNRHVYTRILLDSLKRKALAKEKEFPGILDPGRVRRCRTFREFDREVTARLNGFRDEVEYWEKSSSVHYLEAVQVPSLLVHADDDPFFPARLMPLDRIRRNRFLHPLFVERGGHLGFLAGALPWRQPPWLEDRILGFFETVWKEISSESLTVRQESGTVQA